jgi:hypothetical protein
MKYFTGLLCVLLYISCDKNASFGVSGEEPAYSSLNKNEYADYVVKPSKVDKLYTNDAVEEFIHTTDTNFRQFYLRPFKDLDMYGDGESDSKGDSIFNTLVNKYKVNKNFYKTDFDKNGYTDLLVMGRWEYLVSGSPNQKRYIENFYVIMNFGLEPAKVLNVGRGSILPILKKINGNNFLDLHREVRDYDYSGNSVKVAHDSVTVLQWATIGFTEYNSVPKDYNIETIQFFRGPCFGQCPMYEFTIHKDGSALFYADQDNFPNEYYTCRSGVVYSSQIKIKDLSSLIYFLNYLDFPTLQHSFSIGGSDMSEALLIITYDNGKVKKINDYGLSGTYGLRTLYAFMQELRFNQKWEEVENPNKIRIKYY